MIYATALLTLLATARVTRFVTTDVLFNGPRTWLVNRLMPTGEETGVRQRAAYLLVCSWCASVYVGGALGGAWYAWGDTMWYMTATLALAASYVTGALADRTED